MLQHNYLTPSMAQNYHGKRTIGSLFGKDNYGPSSGKIKAVLIVSIVWTIVNKTRARPRAPPNVMWNGDQTIVIK